MFHNQGWEFPSDLGGGTIQKAPLQKALTLWEASRIFMTYPESKAKSDKALKRHEQALVNLAELFGKDTVLKDYNGPRKLDSELRWKSRPC
jgi:hypothetical protein